MAANTILEKLRHHGHALKNVPKSKQTYEMCVVAVENNGNALCHVSKKLMTPELCMKAVKNKGEAIKYVPDDLKTIDLCMEAMKDYENAFLSIPEKLRDRKTCAKALSINIKVAKYVPQKYLNPKICLKAVKAEASMIVDLPKELLTRDAYMEALVSDISLFRNVPREFLDEEICMRVAKDNPSNIKYLPEDLISSEICEYVMEMGAYNLMYLPDSKKTSVFCMEYIKNELPPLEEIITQMASMEATDYAMSGLLKKDISNSFNINEFYDRVVQYCDHCIKYIPENMRTPELLMAAYKINEAAIKYFPREMLTYAICLATVREIGTFLKFVPKELMTTEICRDAVIRHGTALEYVPREFRTAAIYLAALINDPDALKYTDTQFWEMIIENSGNDYQKICKAKNEGDWTAMRDIIVPVLMEICASDIIPEKRLPFEDELTPESFRSRFGFASVSMDPSISNTANMKYLAVISHYFEKLAEVLCIPEDNIGNGKVDFAFRAKNKYPFYRSNSIHLTKNHIGDALVHEWGHWLYEEMVRQLHMDTSWLIHHCDISGNDPIKREFYKNALALEQRGSEKVGQWANDTELFARAFQKYICDKMVKQGIDDCPFQNMNTLVFPPKEDALDFAEKIDGIMQTLRAIGIFRMVEQESGVEQKFAPRL